MAAIWLAEREARLGRWASAMAAWGSFFFTGGAVDGIDGGGNFVSLVCLICFDGFGAFGGAPRVAE